MASRQTRFRHTRSHHNLERKEPPVVHALSSLIFSHAPELLRPEANTEPAWSYSNLQELPNRGRHPTCLHININSNRIYHQNPKRSSNLVINALKLSLMMPSKRKRQAKITFEPTEGQEPSDSQFSPAKIRYSRSSQVKKSSPFLPKVREPPSSLRKAQKSIQDSFGMLPNLNMDHTTIRD